jgi:hypothetical protein
MSCVMCGGPTEFCQICGAKNRQQPEMSDGLGKCSSALKITCDQSFSVCAIDQNTVKVSPLWISVEDRLPEFGISTRYLFLNGKKEITLGYAYPIQEGWDTGNPGSIWINDMDRQTNEVATHWMPLPSPPEDK